MPGKIVSHETFLTIDTEFIDLKQCFEAFRRGVELKDKSGEDILVVCNSIDTIEYQLKNGDSFLLTYDPVHRVIAIRMFLYEGDQVLKPLYIYNNREYQIACEFIRQIMGNRIEIDKEWLA